MVVVLTMLVFAVVLNALHVATMALIIPALLGFSMLSSLVRRMHDIGITVLAVWPVITLVLISQWMFFSNGFAQITYLALDRIGADGEVFFSETPTDVYSVELNSFTIAFNLAAITAVILLGLICLRPSQPNSNQYGPNPHEVTP